MGIQANLFDGMVIFVEVVNSGSFTKAAENTGHSTSYISKEINKLEERLGVRLMHRTTRTLSLTPEGEIYFEQCQQIIEDANEAENAVSGKQGEPKGVLRISCPTEFGLSSLRPVLAEYTALYPKISLELDLNDRKVDLIADGFDVVIRATARMEDSTLVSRLVARSEGVTLASPEYLAKHGMPADPYQLDRHKMLCYSNKKQPDIWEYQGANGEPIRVHVQCHVTTNNSALLLALCVAGQGIAFLPRFVLADELETGQLVELFPDLPKLAIGTYMVYPSRKHMSAKVRSFIDFVMERLGD